ncbi:MAG: hypothetical protein AAF226_17540, partial [Verrucomicrobiota bacterium]
MVYSELYGTVKAVFNKNEWAFAEVEGREVIRAGFEAYHTRVNLHVQTFPDFPVVSVVAEGGRSTDDVIRRERLAELVMRVNTTLNLGAFELEWDTGR